MLDKMSAPTSLASLMNATIVKPKDSMSQTQIKSFELIDSKFNELAKKILEEFAQVQYSNDFFQALDEVLKEPISKTFTHNHRIGQKLRYFNRKVSRQSSMNSTSGSCFNHPSQAADQPRSLPVEAARQLTGRLQQQQQQQQQRVSARQKSAVPASTISDGYNQANIVKRSSPIESQTSSRPTHPMAKSATIGDTLSKRQPALRKSPSGTENPKAASVLVREPKSQILAQTQQQQQHQPLTQKDINPLRRTRIHSATTTTNSLAKKVARPIRAYNDFGDSDESNEDDDLDDLDDIDDFEDDLEYLSSSDRGFNPIVKSKTASDATNISEINYNLSSSKLRATGNAKQQQQLEQKQSHQEQTLKPYQSVVQKQEQKLYPVVRSNTIGNASLDRASYQRDHLAEPRSATLNSKDIGSLYKPHMNYSTSVLGNHRLSDDDEIIIIPTQSPSLISNSPDGDANADDPNERFSISRTKSFWERLSKGNPNKRALKYAETGPGAETLDDDPTLMSSSNNKTNALHYQQLNGGNKVIGVRANGHSHNLDRMDSTGGSNSNYSCSSSGDENGGGSQSQRARPMTDQLLEINRQNRFRQTR